MARRLTALLLLLVVLAPPAGASKKALFDNTKAETAGNADWIIDTDQPLPLPDQSTIGAATPRTVWLGAISSWGVDLVKRGYTVATLTSTYGITYGNAGNPYDLSKYDVFIVPEPNVLFTAAETNAILSFVRDGGGLVFVTDHWQSDRNNDGYDSPMIWNALDPNRLFGVHAAVSGEANNNITQTSTTVNSSPSDSIIRNPTNGTVTGLAFHNGTTFTLDPASNPTVRGEVWMSGSSGTTNVMAASAVYGDGRLFIAGDSSPIDDGSAQPGNSSIYDGWGEAGATDSTLFVNATIWATRRSAPAGDAIAPVVAVTSPNGGEAWKAGSSHQVTWTASDNVGVTLVDLAWSSDGGASFPNAIATGITNSGAWWWTVPVLPTGAARVRVTAHDAAGNLGRDSSATSFTIDEWQITASAGAGGSISPQGTVGVAQGASQAFALAAGSGWAVADVVVDGGSVGAVSGYTFDGVAANHTIAASFADVAGPAVTVLAPVGGEEWAAGAVEEVRWSATDNVAVDSVEVDWSASGPGGPWLPVAHGLSNTGSLSWAVPGMASDSARVRVMAYDQAHNAGVGVSPGDFRVVDASAGVAAGPAVLSLARPAPNPGRGSALLRFSLPQAGPARLEVLDPAGRRVLLADGDWPAGWSTVRWEEPAGAGLYFVRLTTPWGSRSERVVRLK